MRLKVLKSLSPVVLNKHRDLTLRKANMNKFPSAISIWDE